MEKLKRVSLVLVAGLVLIFMIQPALAGKGKININTATKKELVTLKHVGDKLADRIIEYRKDHPFKKAEDIMLVKGVGEKVYNANKDAISVTDD